MSRPKTKNELLEQSSSEYTRLLQFINDLDPLDQNQLFPEGYLNRNIRDLLAHLHAWHLMCLEWYEVGMNGQKPHMPAKGFTWKMTPDLNRLIQKKYTTESLDQVSIMLHDSYQKVQAIILSHTNEELFEKKRFKWTGSTSLGAYLVSATSSHYAWAYKLIKKCRKEMKS